MYGSDGLFLFCSRYPEQGCLISGHQVHREEELVQVAQPSRKGDQNPQGTMTLSLAKTDVPRLRLRDFFAAFLSAPGR